MGRRHGLVQLESRVTQGEEIRRADPRAVVTTDNPTQPVVVHGTVVRVSSAPAVATFTDRVNAKYETDIPVTFFTENACFRLEPSQVFGLDEADFTTSPTRWTFPDRCDR